MASLRRRLRRLAPVHGAEAALVPLFALALFLPPAGLAGVRWWHWLGLASLAATAAAAYLRIHRGGSADRGAFIALLLAALLLVNGGVRVSGGVGSVLWPSYFLFLAVATSRFSRWWEQTALFGIIVVLETVQSLMLAGEGAPPPEVLRFSKAAGAIDFSHLALGLSLLGIFQLLFHVLYLNERQHLREIATEHHRLREEAESLRRLEEYRSGPELTPHSPRGKMARRISVVEEFDRHLDRLLGLARRALGAETVVLFLREGNRLVFRRAAEGEFEVDRQSSIRLGEGVIGGAAKLQQPLLMANIGKGHQRVKYFRDGGSAASLVVAPVLEGDVLRGALVADHPLPEKFSRSELEVFEGFAMEVNLLLENIRESSVRDRRSATMETLCDLSELLSSTLKLDEMLDNLVDKIKVVVPYDQAAVFLVDERRRRVILKAPRGFRFDSDTHPSFPMNKGLVGYIIAHGQPLVFSDRKKMEIIPGYKGLDRMRSILGLPLRFRDELKGAIIFASSEPGNFTSYQLETLKLLVNQVTAQVSNAYLHQEMEQMAITDGLTGLYNHRHFQESLSHELKRSARHEQSLSLLLLDLDHFKKLNDTCGHPFGDEVLKGVSAQLSLMARNIDLVARYGGEEFALILGGTGRRGAKIMAQRILKVVRALAFTFEGKAMSVTVSVGSATFPEDGREKEDLVRHADQALYTSKHSGRNMYTPYKDVR